MQKQSFEQHINDLEREIYKSKCKIKELDKVVSQQNGIMQQQKLRINDLEEKNIGLNNKLFQISEEKNEIQHNKDMLDSQIRNLQEQILLKVQCTDTDQQQLLENDLKEKKNVICQLEKEIQILRYNLDHSDLERQKLEEELKTRSLNKIIYINNDALTDVLQNYNQYFENCNAEKQSLFNQVQQQKAQLEKTINENQKKVDRLQVIIKNGEEKKRNLEEEKQNLNNLIENQKKTLEDQNKLLQEQIQLRLTFEKEAQAKQQQNEQQLKEQQEQIAKLQQKINSSNSIVFDMVNMIIPSDMEELLEIKQQLMKKEEELKDLKELNKSENLEKRKLQDLVEKELPFVKQRKQEFEQLMAISQQLKKKLEQEITLNRKLKETQNQLEIDIQQLKQKDQFNFIEILKLRSENLEYRTQVAQTQNIDAQLYINQLCQENQQLKNQIEQIQINYQSYNRPLNQWETLQQDNLNLQYTLKMKEEEIQNLREKVNLMNQEKALGLILNNKVEPVVHKIEKIKVRSEKKQSLLNEFRNQRMEKRKLEYKIDELEFQISKLQSQYQLERDQKEFLEKRLNYQKEDFGRKTEQFKKRHEELEFKMKELQSEMNLNSINQEHINYHQQNQVLYQQNMKDKQLINQQHQEIKKYAEEIQILKGQLSQKERQIKELEGGDQKGLENKKLLEMELQRDNDKIIIDKLREEINKIKREKSEIYNQFLNQKQINEQIQQEQIQEQSIQSWKKSEEYLSKRIIQLKEESQKNLQELKGEFQMKFEQKQQENWNLEQEIQELKQALEEYKSLYQQEKLNQIDKSGLSLNEIQDLNEKLNQTIMERDKLLRKRQNVEKRDDDLRKKEESLNTRELEVNDVQNQFEQKRLKQIQEIEDQLTIQRNKELSILGCEYILKREIEDYKQKFFQEQYKVCQFQQKLNLQQKDQDNDLQWKGHENDLQQEKQENLNGQSNQKNNCQEQEMSNDEMKLNEGMQIEVQQILEEERQIYQNCIKENIKVNELKQLMEIVQNGKLLAYLEKAKQIHEDQKNKTEEI